MMLSRLTLFLALAALAGAQENRVVLREAATAPTVDGILTPGEYDQALQLHHCMFASGGGSRKARQYYETVYLTRHAGTLYAVYISPMRPGEYPKSNIFVKDAVMIATDPCLEWFVQPPTKAGQVPSYYQFIGNVRGTWWDCHFMPTIGQGITGWDGHYRFRNSIDARQWIAEISVPLADLGVAPEEIVDGFELKVDFCRDGGRGALARSYRWAFHGWQRHVPVVFAAHAPAVAVLDFGQFPDRRFTPEVRVRTPDRPATVEALFQVLAKVKDTATDAYPILAEKTLKQAIPKGGEATFAAAFDLAAGQQGNARIRLTEADGTVLYERTYPFVAEDLPEDDFVPTAIEPFSVQAYWAPSLGKVHVLADALELKTAPATVELVVTAPDGSVAGTGTIDHFVRGGGSCNIVLAGGRLAAGTWQVTGIARDDTGTELARGAVTYERQPYAWENSTVGYSDKVLRPWTPLRTEGNVVGVWGRTYTLGALGLPERLRSLQPEPTRGPATRELLAAPVELVVEAGGKRLAWDGAPLALTEASETSVRTGATAVAPGLTYAMNGKLDFDGCYRIDLTIRPQGPTQVDSIRVEVPLPGDCARLLHSVGEMMRSNNTCMALPATAGVLWDSATHARNALVQGNFLPWVWVGDEDRGIGWMANNDATWVLDHNKPCLDVVRAGDQVRLRLHLLNRPGVIVRPITASFSLQATPVRPRPPGGSWRDHDRITVDFWGGSRGRGGGWGWMPKWPDKVKDYAAGWHQQNPDQRLFCYECAKESDMGSQATLDFFGEWMAMPLYKNKTLVRSCADWSLDCYQWWYEHCGVVGHYYDNSFPCPSANQMNGIGWLDEDGRARAGYSMFEMREFWQRVETWLQTLPENQGTWYNLYMHMTDAATVSNLGWSGMWLAGESGGFADPAVKDPDAVDRWGHDRGLDHLRAYALGRQYGVITTWCTGYDKMGTVFGLHDIASGWGGAGDYYRNFLGDGTRNRFDMHNPDLRFMPYWDARTWYTVEQGERVRCAAWTLPGMARVQVSNLGPAAATIRLNLDMKLLGVAPDVEISRELDGQVYAHDGGRLEVPVGRHEFVALLLAPKGTFRTGPPTDIARLNPGPDLPEFRDRFDSLSSAWESTFNHAPSWVGNARDGVNNATFEPFFGALRIHTRGGFANVSRAFGKDNVSVRVRMYTPAGQECGNPDRIHPMAALYWAPTTCVKTVLTNPYLNHDAALTDMLVVGVDGGKRRQFQAPKPALVTWARFDLTPATVVVYMATDTSDWQRVGEFPRDQGFAGPPSHLVLGIGCVGEQPLLRNESVGITDSYSFYDELIVQPL